MGQWKKQFDQVAAKAIQQYAAHYQTHPDQTGICMLLDKKDKVAFFTMIGQNVKERVKFLHIVQGLKAKVDFTGKSVLFPLFIGKAMVRMSDGFGIPRDKISLIARLDDGEVYLFLMSGPEIVKILSEEEVMTDEQMVEDQLTITEEMQP